MPPDKREIRAAEFALGTLSGEERAGFRRAAEADPALAALGHGWERRLAGLTTAIAPVAPPAAMWATISARINDDDEAMPCALTVGASEGEWREVIAGVAIKMLFVDPPRGVRSFLLRMAPGARLPAHPHAHAEECLMLTGDLCFGSLTLAAGDYHRVPTGVAHGEGVSHGGCLAFVRGPLDLALA